ncbi:MAG: CPBP family intramembrane metalloprotease [Gemmatimonadaceae bacterium]|nr:CPBP family intramembrane metalloprotease [Gemmatimonadaceae bacterium]
MTAPRVAARAFSERSLLILLGWAAIAVIAAEFVLIPMRTRVWFPDWSGTLKPFAWWSIGLAVLWVIVPAILLRREGPLPFSVALPKTRNGIALYAGLIAVMIPALLLASRRPDFLNTYPLLHAAPPLAWSGGLLWAYWLCYGSILFSTEFFFRGVLLFGLESRLGVAAVGVSVLPYCLIHAHKPLPEAFGSIVAGYVLGVLALRTRSIGGGVVVHCAVAFGMDTLALLRA